MYIGRLCALQNQHGLSLANKITQKHVDFQRNKMKVSLAVQAIASNSTAKSLRWLQEHGIDGFEDNDVIVTAEFFELNNDFFDILNSRGTGASGFKSALTRINIHEILSVFQMVKEVYQSLDSN